MQLAIKMSSKVTNIMVSYFLRVVEILIITLGWKMLIVFQGNEASYLVKNMQANNGANL